MLETRYCPVCKSAVLMTQQGTCPLGHPLEAEEVTPQPSEAPDAAPPPLGESAAAASAAQPPPPPPPDFGPAQPPADSEGAATTPPPLAAADSPGGGPRTAVIVGVAAAAALLVVAAVAALVLLPRLRSDDADSVANSASQVAPPAAGASTTATQTGEPSEDSVEAPVKPIASGPVDPTQEQKEWALATCAIITEINGGRHDLLGGAEPSPRVAESWKEGLEQWWGVSSREDLLDTLDWIESGGHRAGFDAMAQDLSRMSPEQIADLQKQIEGDPELSSQVSVVLDDYERLGDKSLVGWDYARYVSLCGWGYLVGYLEEDEAWERIIPAAQLVQNTFDSWEDLGENYMIGREFWSYQQTQQNGAEWAACERRLHRSPDSPWVRIPWDVDLTQPGQ